ncbi:MAG TPA: SRPBCC family protein [Planococcus sp. (in: firmicutes)]|nr:SRPBCC family protein [Planococcus sp. (in: firmicutes)]
MAFTETVYIDAPVETVFAITTDFAHSPMIMANVMKTEMLTEGPMQVGTQVKEVRNVRGKEVETVLVVTEFMPNETFTVRSESAGMTVEYQYLFKAEESGTTVDFTGSLHSKGLKNALIKPLFEKVLKKEDKDHLISLKEYIEQQKTD